MNRRSCTQDHGFAAVEFLAVPILLLPLLALALHLLAQLQLEVAMDDASRQASRAYAVAVADPLGKAEAAVHLTLADAGVASRVTPIAGLHRLHLVGTVADPGWLGAVTGSREVTLP